MLEGTRIEQVAESTLMKVVARLVMPPLFLVALSIASWYLSKQSDTLEKLNSSVLDANFNSKLMQQRMDNQVSRRDGQVTDIYGRITDHETRIRGLERPRIQ